MNFNFVLGKDFAQHHFLWLGEYGFGYARIQSSYCEGLCFGFVQMIALLSEHLKKEGLFRVQEGSSYKSPKKKYSHYTWELCENCQM